VLGETNATVNENPDAVRRVIFCSGKVYYDLVDDRTKKSATDIAIVRLEQIAPFPFDRMQEHISLYPNAEVMWCQEEPKNMGCWSYVAPRLATSCKAVRGEQMKPTYSGRSASAAPATGLGGKVHAAELRAFLDKAFE
jgi:2-oxoglutarate dehydrogenase E1 component